MRKYPSPYKTGPFKSCKFAKIRYSEWEDDITFVASFEAVDSFYKEVGTDFDEWFEPYTKGHWRDIFNSTRAPWTWQTTLPGLETTSVENFREHILPVYRAWREKQNIDKGIGPGKSNGQINKI